MLLHRIRVVGAHGADFAHRFDRGGRVVAQQCVVELVIAGVEAKAVHAALAPEAHFAEQGVLDFGAMEVEVGLLGQEAVQVVLPPARVPLPGRTAEDREPVGGRRAVGLGVGPHVPVGLGVVARAAAFGEPGVLVGGVREHLVDDELQAQRMHACAHRVEVGQRAVQRIDRAIVGHVVAEVLHGGAEEGRDPDRVDAQAGDVVELRRDAGQVADAVAVAVHEAARVDLVDHRAPPPFAVAAAHACPCGRNSLWHAKSGPAVRCGRRAPRGSG
ncbi:hypothetical protein D9M69_521300 [compost metagenome]